MGHLRNVVNMFKALPATLPLRVCRVHPEERIVFPSLRQGESRRGGGKKEKKQLYMAHIVTVDS